MDIEKLIENYKEDKLSGIVSLAVEDRKIIAKMTSYHPHTGQRRSDIKIGIDNDEVDRCRKALEDDKAHLKDSLNDIEEKLLNLAEIEKDLNAIAPR